MAFRITTQLDIDNSKRIILTDGGSIELGSNLTVDENRKLNASISGTISFDDLTEEQIAQLKGPKGDTGSQGPVGPQGPQGEAGPLGEQGPKGDTGEQGPAGPQGPKGADGTMTFEDLTEDQKELLKGDPGPQGEKGDKGDKGDTGQKGNDGAQGAKGEDGKSAYELAVGTGYPGSLEDWLESLKGIGEVGPQGPQGPQGPLGPIGPKGDPGDAFNPNDYDWDNIINSSRFVLYEDYEEAMAALETASSICKCKKGEDCSDKNPEENPDSFDCVPVSEAFLLLQSDVDSSLADLDARTLVCREEEDTDTGETVRICEGINEAFAKFKTTYDGALSAIGARFTNIEGLLNDKLDTDDFWTTLGYTDREAFERAIEEGGLTQEQINALNNLVDGTYLTSESLLNLIATEDEAGAELRAKFLELTKNNVEDSKIIRVVSTGAGLESVASAVAASNALEAKYASQDSVTDLTGTVSSHTTSIASLTQEVDKKASKTELSSYYKKDNTDNEAIINLIAGEIGPDGEIGSRITISADAIDANTSLLVLGKQGEDHNNLYGTVSLSTESVEYIPRTASSPDVYLGAINLGIDSYLKNKISNIDISDWTISEFDGSANSPAVIYPELEMSSCSIFNNGISNMATGACIPGGINMNPVEGIKLWAVPLTISDTSDNNYEFKAITDNNDVSYLSIGDSLLINSENTIINNKLKIAGQVLTQKELHTGSGSATIMALVINNNFAIASDGRVGVVVDNNGSEEFRSGLNLSETGYNDLASFINSGSTQAGYTVRNGLIVKI